MGELDLKKAGLNIGEDVVKAVISKIVKPYAEYYIMKSENKIDDVLLPFLGSLEGALLEQADKIDGEVG
jgi:hypothetical protein